jgi:quercetin 2,3-dioxygenase
MKQIKTIITAPPKHWVGNGFHVHGFFTEFKEENSPFLLLDYAPSRHFSSSNEPRGVGVHPHRGFETVTFAYKGSITHKDSSGSVGTIKTGDVQWMTAGSGVLHQEYFEDEFNKTGGDFEMVQLWVNLPAEFKMVKPSYQELKSQEIPTLGCDGFVVKVVAGKFEYVDQGNSTITHSGIAKTYSEIDIYQISHGSENINTITISSPIGHTTMLLVLEGNVVCGDKTVESNNLAIFDNSDNNISLTCNSTSKFLFISGEPLNEPISHYGPFVMNTREEILQAIDDYNKGLGKFR